MATNSQKLWNEFCQRMNIASEGVPLFATDEDLSVQVPEVGDKSRRMLLKRSPEMEQFVISTAEKIVSDWKLHNQVYEGLIYLMFRKDPKGRIIPLYIGKTETYGKNAGNLSANIENLNSNRGKFARWGDGYQYHIGDLSAVVLGHSEKAKTRKYQTWAETLFEKFPVIAPELPKLKEQVYFWTKAWNKEDIGPWEDFGPTNLTFLEYLMIGVASSVYPENVLNKEGQNRG